jgi:hypothetical protein
MLAKSTWPRLTAGVFKLRLTIHREIFVAQFAPIAQIVPAGFEPGFREPPLCP